MLYFDLPDLMASEKEMLDDQIETYRRYGQNDKADAILNSDRYQYLANNDSVKQRNENEGIFRSWFNNALTGQRDFNRQVALQQMQQDFNSAEAVKAYQRQLNIAQNSTKWQAEQLHQLGVNPAWAIAGGGGSSSSIATAPTATSQAGSASASGSQFGAAMSTLGQLVMTAAKLAIQANTPYLKGVFIPKK